MTDNLIKGGSILFAVMIIILPMGWVLISSEPPGPYIKTESSRVQAALEATGLNLCQQTESTWQVSGALGGNSILVSDDCSEGFSGEAIYIHTQNFDSVETRDAAVRLIQRSITIKALNGAVYTYGSYVIAIQGSAGGEPVQEVVERVTSQLQR
jgi:hypothetical protein